MRLCRSQHAHSHTSDPDSAYTGYPNLQLTDPLPADLGPTGPIMPAHYYTLFLFVKELFLFSLEVI